MQTVAIIGAGIMGAGIARAVAAEVCRGRWYERKSWRGFYDYSGEKPVPTR